ncbi:hypothetical protein DCAR_0519124 [Daucus carota subsp. sativus]|uniref:RING-type E3 ubiquitin transferase n=1 Tax=Daucus carota subsp. sativus TaxID=79200 RepID=A0A164XQP3_DAUCS|nr:PREDICTED: E3 ubiquitin-protein ligase CIP8-like [Daucus carota subsp. sativus]WOG99768.1 hypothetical protein DCAR_0519124 [Daucus carota subsp. sativus]
MADSQQPAPRRSRTRDMHVEYWCHQCNRRVNGETLDDNQVVCSRCHDGFLVSIAPSPSASLEDMLQQVMQELHIQNNEGLMRRAREIYRERVQSSGAGRVGNYGDYADEAEYEAILLGLAESDDGADRGAPPAAESAVAALKSVEIGAEEEGGVCVVCKDMLSVGETARELPCGHAYHGDCIVAWLATRNMCPVCRFELPTSDPDYEEERIRKVSGAAGGSPKASNSLPDE